MYRLRMIEVANGDLTMAQLAERTGLAAGTLRMWESRHGFPSPQRQSGRHRRYTPQDVDLVREVVRMRAHGLSLTAAIDSARRASSPLPVSVFAGLRQLRPAVQPVVLSKRVLLGLTHAIEDEYCAHAAHGLLIGCFQREHFYRRAERRWLELARSAELAVALADFEAIREPPGAPAEVPIEPTQPLSREWTLVVDAPGARACLAAWEQPTQTELPDPQRRFEVLWSFEPAVVRAASGVAAELLGRLAPTIARRLPASLYEPFPDAPPELRFATSLAHRMVGYLGAMDDERAVSGR